ncbi:MAG: flagellar basal body L-ring protein FlgH [Deltaproteobacteria bacterium]|nr:flagellar basal body L-ring protein FlgH [Deltaproteobacteria bacterium]
MTTRLIRNLIIGLMLPAILLGIGCGSSKKEVKIDKEESLPALDTYPTQQKSPGSLWSSGGNSSDLYADYKARQVGDIVTITIVETTTGTNTGTTNASRASGVDASVTSMLGLPANMGMGNFLGSGEQFNPAIKAATTNTFKGSGDTTQTGKLSGTITARVIEVMPNGNMKIRGTRAMKINNEDQLIAITGVVRPRDISRTNVVLSSFVADAKIEYSGQGTVSDQQRPGWMARMVNWAWPF